MNYGRIAFLSLAACALAVTGAGTAGAEKMYASEGDIPANKPIIAPMIGNVYITDDADNLLQYNRTRNDIAISLSGAETDFVANALRGLKDAPPIAIGPVAFRPGALVAIADSPGVQCAQVVFGDVAPDRRSGNYALPPGVSIAGQVFGYSADYCR